MEVISIKDYTDKELKRNIKSGEILNVSNERALVLILKDVAKKLEDEPTEKVQIEKPKQTRKKRK